MVMTLRRKTFLTSGLTFISLIILLFAISIFITKEGFTDIENKGILRDVERALNVIEEEIAMLDVTTHDFASWDDTYVFIRNRNRSYISANLRDPAFTKLRINYILYVNISGKIVFGKSFDLKNGGETPFPRALQQQMAANHLFTRYEDGLKSVSGIMLLPDGPMIVSSWPILNSEESEPVRGTLIMGRSLDYFKIKKFAKMTNLSLVVHQIDDEQMPPDMKELSASLSTATPIISRALNNDIIAGYALIKDVFGKPALILRVDESRAVYKQGQATLQYLLAALFLIALVFSFVTFLLVEKSVLQRLTKLSSDVRKIAAAGHFSQRVSHTGNDELSNLANEINGMMEKLEQAEKFREEVSEARYRAVVEDQTELICRYLPDGTITFVNDAFCRYFEREKNVVIGTNFMSLNQKEQEKLSGHTDTFSAKNTGKKRESQVSKPNGEIRWLQWTDRALVDQHGKIIEFQSVGRDITHEMKLESQLRQVQKMEAIGTLAGGIAHDFNNILGGIIGFTELALYKCREDACKRNLGEVLKASARAKSLVAQILTFSRQGEQEKKPVDFGVITKETLKLLRSSIPSTINISENITSNSHTVLADATQLHQILMNLCTNAAHAMREHGGVMTVDLDSVDIDSRELSLHPGFQMGPYIRLAVSDTGCGIDPSIIERIFDPFFTTKKAGEGTGLGLSVVYGIVKSHGGVINVYSEPGRGTTFKVYLPRIETADLTVTKSTEPLPGGNERILFVDDEEFLIEVGREMLQSLGYNVVGRTSSIEALKAFRAHPARYDLVITDMTMPNMTGVELAGEILRVRPDLPVILCTGFSELLNDGAAARLGIRKILMKPLFINDLAWTIRDILGEGTHTKRASS